MRVEDLDGPRSKPEAVTGNLKELRWLGLDWDEGPDVGGPHAPYLQSQRGRLYQTALDALAAAGHLFECYLSRKDLAEIASAPHGGDAAGRVAAAATRATYGPAERALNAATAPAKRAAGKPASLRFAVPREPLEVRDEVMGTRTFAPGEVGDFVVRRADGQWAYQLAVVVDDAAMDVTEVVRGADLLAATPAQLLLYQALSLTPPAFAHLPLLLDERGERLAKRSGALALSELERAGVRPARVVGWLAYTLGQLAEPEEVEAGELVESFAAGLTPRDPVRLDAAATRWLLGGTP